MEYSKTVDKDKFYTNPNIAKSCVMVLNKVFPHLNYLKIIEPSAGNGSFSNLLNCTAYDICPDDKDEKIIKADFFEVKLPDKPFGLVGNPPFGLRNKLTKAFIKKGVDDPNCKLIAFVLPECFDKITNQKVFPDDWCLLESFELPPSSFIVGEEPFHVPCVFYIWARNDVSGGVNKREKPYTEVSPDFTIVRKDEEADLFVFGAAPRKIIPPVEVNENNRGYYLKSHIDPEVLKSKILDVDWKSFGKSSVNGGVFWLTKTEFLRAYIESYKD